MDACAVACYVMWDAFGNSEKRKKTEAERKGTPLWGACFADAIVSKREIPVRRGGLLIVRCRFFRVIHRLVIAAG